MIIGISSSGDSLDSPLDKRFGRCEYFILLDSDSGETVSILENSARQLSGAAGVTSVQMLADKGVTAIIAQDVGPKAQDALKALNIKTFRPNADMTVAEVFKDFQEGNLKETVFTSPKGLYKP